MDETRVKNISSQCVSSNIIFCYILLSISDSRSGNKWTILWGQKWAMFWNLTISGIFTKKDSFHFHYVKEFIKVRVKQSEWGNALALTATEGAVYLGVRQWQWGEEERYLTN